MKEFDGEVVWVTGASSGIGRAVARQLVEGGAKVIATARNREALESLGDETGAPERVRVLPADLTVADERKGAVEEARAWKGRVDTLMHIAGLSQRGEALATELSVSRRIMELNFFAPVALTRAVAPEMIERGHGRIVFVGSIAAWVATPKRSTLSASKAAISRWAESLRAELVETGVSVTVAQPASVATGISERALLADGSRNGSVEDADEEGYPPDECAAEILKAAATSERQVIPGGPPKLLVYLKRFFPGLLARLLPKLDPE